MPYSYREAEANLENLTVHRRPVNNHNKIQLLTNQVGAILAQENLQIRGKIISNEWYDQFNCVQAYYALLEKKMISNPFEGIPGIPNIAGSYKLRGDDNVVAQFAQDAGTITAAFQIGFVNYEGEGTWNDSFFEYIVTQRNLLTGHTTKKMLGKLTVSRDGTLTHEVTSEVTYYDGGWNLPEDRTDIYVWVKN